MVRIKDLREPYEFEFVARGTVVYSTKKKLVGMVIGKDDAFFIDRSFAHVMDDASNELHHNYEKVRRGDVDYIEAMNRHSDDEILLAYGEELQNYVDVAKSGTANEIIEALQPMQQLMIDTYGLDKKDL